MFKLFDVLQMLFCCFRVLMMLSFLKFVSYKERRSRKMKKPKRVRTRLMVTAHRDRTTSVDDITRVSSGWSRRLDFNRLCNHGGFTDLNVCRCAYEAVVGGVVRSSEDNGPSWCRDFRDSMLLDIEQVGHIAYANSVSTAITSRHLCKS